MSGRPRGKNRDRQDFSYLLAGNPEGGEEQGTIPEHVTAAPSLYRSQVMSDENVRFVAIKSTRVIHVKRCVDIKLFPDDSLIPLKDYDTSFRPCEHCYMQAYIMCGARDPQAMDIYAHFFERIGIAHRNIRKLFVDMKCQTRMIGTDCLFVQYGDERWEIVYTGHKYIVELRHNNYYVSRAGIRSFAAGFHTQKENCTLDCALKIIENYEFSPSHIEKYRNLHGADPIPAGYAEAPEPAPDPASYTPFVPPRLSRNPYGDVIEHSRSLPARHEDGSENMNGNSPGRKCVGMERDSFLAVLRPYLRKKRITAPVSPDKLPEIPVEWEDGDDFDWEEMPDQGDEEVELWWDF